VQCPHARTWHCAACMRVLENRGLILMRTVPYRGPDADVIDGAEQGEAEYALTKPEWEALGAW